MESRPPGLTPPLVLLPLLLASFLLLHPRPCVGQHSWYTISGVDLQVRPNSTVETGTPVTFRCQVEVSQSGTEDLTHTFVFVRDEIQVNSTATTDSTAEYQLSAARAADSGTYECRVTVKEKSRGSNPKRLEVTGLQTPVLEINNTRPYATEEFTARCSAPGEKGQLIFRFYQKSRTGEVTNLKQLVAAGNSLETTLVLTLPGDSLLYCDYAVNLVSGPRSSNRSMETQMISRELHIIPTMNVFPSQSVYEGDKLTVICRVHTQIDVELYLIKGKEILQRARNSLTHQFQVKEGDSGELVCRSEWGTVQKENYTPITVKELFSKPQLTLRPIDVFENERFKLDCTAHVYATERINASALQFFIYRDYVRLSRAKSLVDMAYASKNGNYTCRVQVSSFSFVKESQPVVLKAKVPPSKPVLSVVGGTLVLGKPFRLMCHSNNGTLPIVYTLNGPSRFKAKETVTTAEERAVFNVSAIHASARINDFLCHASNSERREAETGHMLRYTNIIEPVSKPALHIRPMMGDVAEGQEMILVCSVQGGSLPVSFAWYRAKKTDQLASVTVNKLEASHKISVVNRDHQGAYFCVSTNAANEAKQSPTIMIAVKMAGWKKGLIAVFCILVVLALVLLVVFKRRLLHFKKKTGATLSVKSTGTKAERLSLTQAEANTAANATPGMMGKSIWSEHVSGSESEDQRSVTSPEKAEPQYTEVQTTQADPCRAPVKKGTETVYSEVRQSVQGVPEPAEAQGSVEYAQLNHDADHHGDHGVWDGEAEGTTTVAATAAADRCEFEHEQAPDCD